MEDGHEEGGVGGRTWIDLPAISIAGYLGHRNGGTTGFIRSASANLGGTCFEETGTRDVV